MEKAAVNGNGKTTVHLILQGKGGVGKSLVSSILAQYFRDKQKTVHCFDTDPINATLAQYAELNAEHVNVLRRGSINEKEFDSIVERVCRERGFMSLTPVRRRSCHCGTTSWRMRFCASWKITAAWCMCIRLSPEGKR